MTRILLGGLFHETHTFVEDITRADAMHTRVGAELLARRGDASTVDGFLAVAERHGWTVVPTLETMTLPSGTLDHAIFEDFWTRFEAMARPALAEGLDGIWLALHGAMVTTGSDDPEGELLERIRSLPGAADLPLFAVFDLHATFTPRMARFADGLVGYRENPHADARDAAVLSAELLARSLRTRVRPRMVSRNYPLVWPPTGTGTADRPMRSMSECARAIERDDPAVWAVSIVGGYSFADTFHTGVAAVVITDGDAAAAERHLDAIGEIAVRERELGVPAEWELDAAIDDALARPPAGPCILVEPADNIGGGAPGDCTSILRAFVARGLDNAAVVIADAAAVKAFSAVAPGTRIRRAIGGSSRLDPGPLELEMELLSRSDGRFRLEDVNSHLAAAQGVNIEMGPSATVRCGGVTILLTSRKTPPFDLGQLRSQGIEPERLSFVGVKAAVAHRRAYDRLGGRSYWVRTPGPCPSDLTTLPYRKIRRPIFPLDPPWRPA
ncbi:M81 family metallopeptidase [Alsobacter sp. SYSU M60028]|uniref:Microcystinase C n=1 Tax=Alsobacter ponti TaxID=2962936 RepID=A0ABT1L8C6_9HYPH|nr:M81 family metallopeptidase [Alsobacter ponti]MCP8937739.1 M81 family metallopeptidase [Alsobacter ponti]